MKYLLPLLLLTACEKRCVEAHPETRFVDMYFEYATQPDGSVKSIFHPSNEMKLTVCDKYE